MTALPPAPWFVDPTAAPPAWPFPFHKLEIGEQTVAASVGNLVERATFAARSYALWLADQHGITWSVTIKRLPPVVFGQSGGVAIRRTA